MTFITKLINWEKRTNVTNIIKPLGMEWRLTHLTLEANDICPTLIKEEVKVIVHYRVKLKFCTIFYTYKGWANMNYNA